MIKNIYKINDEGIYVDVFLANLNENKYYNGDKWAEINFDFVVIKPPHSKIVKWENEKWIVVEEYPLEPLQPKVPTKEERLEALEQAMLEIALGGI